MKLLLNSKFSGELSPAQLGDGSVLLPTALRVPGNMGFSGPLSVHIEYGSDMEPALIEQYAGEDAAYLRQLEAKPGSSSPTKN